MRTGIIQFLSVTQGQLQTICPYPTQQQRLILNTTTGAMYWDFAGVRYTLNVQQMQADWQESDSSQMSYIKSKPVVPQDISQLTDITGITKSSQVAINPEDVTQLEGAYKLAVDNLKIPSYIKAPSNKVYTIQGQSIQVQGAGLKLNLNRYMAYQNLNAITVEWSLIYV